MAVRVVSGIFPLVLIDTSVVMEHVANLSFPSRQQMCLLHLPSALYICMCLYMYVYIYVYICIYIYIFEQVRRLDLK